VGSSLIGEARALTNLSVGLGLVFEGRAKVRSDETRIIVCRSPRNTGKSLVDRNVEGKVRFFRENLRVTYDFSKKVATIVRDTF